MKKLLFGVAIAAFTLSSCSSIDELGQAQMPEAEDGAVVFSAYTGRTTRGATERANMTLANLKTEGFGVFAYEQSTKSFAAYNATSTFPNFMFNQEVTFTSPDWVYAPIKYYNNNPGAKHSFFAYAPFINDADIDPVFNVGANPAIRYKAGDNTDILWSEPIVDIEKPGVTYKLQFNFKHALSKVSVKIAPFVDYVHDGTHTDDKGLDGNTKIVVRNVRLVGKTASQALLDLGTGEWTTELTNGGVYEKNDVIELTDANSSAPGKYLNYITDMFVIPSKGVKFEITYDVVTTDPTGKVENNSRITQTITSEESFDIQQGKSNTFYLDLGLTSVKFEATVADWDAAAPEQNVDLPNNLPYTLLGTTSSISALKVEKLGAVVDAAAFSGMAVGDILMGSDYKAYRCTKAEIAGTPVTPAEFEPVYDQYLLNSDDTKLYVLGAGGVYAENTIKTTLAALNAITSTTEPGYYLIGENIYYVEWR